MTDLPETDTYAQWNIKAFPVGLRMRAAEAARLEGVSLSDWLERRIREWVADGSPTRVASPSPAGTASPAQILGMLADMGRAGITAQKRVGTLANRLVKRELANALGYDPLGAPPRRIAAPE